MKSKSGGGKATGDGGDEAEDSHPPSYRQMPRKNGWTCPPHILQVVAWFFLLLFNVFYFGVVVPVLPYEWQPAGYIIVGIFMLCHAIAHVMCLTINPGDPGTFRRKKKEMPNFDRKQHSHVIENNHCYLCEVSVHKSSKHCSACNKCVVGFDHHCKWLNNCIGSRNYKIFIACLVTSFLSCLLVCGVSLYVCITYWVKPVLLHPDELEALRANEPFSCQLVSTTTLSPTTIAAPNAALATTLAATTPTTMLCDFHQNLKLFAPVPGAAFITVVIILTVLLLVSMILLGHLLCFHMYLISKGLSTYEYIMRQRTDVEVPANDAKDMESKRCCSQHRTGKVAPTQQGGEEIELQSSRKENSEIGRESSNTNNAHSVSDSGGIDIPRETALVQRDTKEGKHHTTGKIKKKKKKMKASTPRSLPPPPLGHQPPYHHPNPASNPNILPPLGANPIPYGEETWIYPGSARSGVGMAMAQGPTETYIEQHIVRRFSIPVDLVQGSGATPMPFPLHASNSVNELVPVSARSLNPTTTAPLTMRSALPPLSRRISIDPPVPALDYHSSSAESLQELASSEHAATIKQLQGVSDLAASYPPSQHSSPARGRGRGEGMGQANLPPASHPVQVVDGTAPAAKKKKTKLKLKLKTKKKKPVSSPLEDRVVDKTVRDDVDEDAGRTSPKMSQTPPSEGYRDPKEGCDGGSSVPTVPLLDLSGVKGEESSSHEDDVIIPKETKAVHPDMEDDDALQRANRRRSLMMMR